jgi:hypothetical protein
MQKLNKKTGLKVNGIIKTNGVKVEAYQAFFFFFFLTEI